MTDLARILRLAGLYEGLSETNAQGGADSSAQTDLAAAGKAHADLAAQADPQVEKARGLIPILDDRIETLFGSDVLGPRLILHIFTRYIEGAIRENQITDDDLRTIMDHTMKLIRLYNSSSEGRIQVMKLAAKSE